MQRLALKNTLEEQRQNKLGRKGLERTRPSVVKPSKDEVLGGLVDKRHEGNQRQTHNRLHAVLYFLGGVVRVLIKTLTFVRSFSTPRFIEMALENMSKTQTHTHTHTQER